MSVFTKEVPIWGESCKDANACIFGVAKGDYRLTSSYLSCSKTS